MKNYVVFYHGLLSDLEVFYLEEKWTALGWTRLPDRGDFVIFHREKVSA